MYHLSVLLLLAVPLAQCRPAGQHPVMVMMMVPGQQLFDSNGMMRNMNSVTMQKVMSESRESMMQQQNQQQQQQKQQQQQNQREEMMQQVEMLRKMAEGGVSTKEMATNSNVAMMEEIISKMAAMLERMREMSSMEQGATEQSVDSTNGQMSIDVTPGMGQQISGMMQEMTRMMKTSDGNGKGQQSAGSDKGGNTGGEIKMKMAGDCTAMGMFLPVKGDSCHYNQCAPGAEVEPGTYSVVPVEMPCAPGRAVADGYEGGWENPCTQDSTSCGMKSDSNSVSQGVQRYVPRD